MKLAEARRTAWAMPLFEHAAAPVARLPVLEVTGGLHLVTDLTLGLGRVAYDYLTKSFKGNGS